MINFYLYTMMVCSFTINLIIFVKFLGNNKRIFFGKIFNYLNNFLKNEKFKKEVEKDFYNLIQRKDIDLFNYYWIYITQNLEKYKNLIKKDKLKKNNELMRIYQQKLILLIS